MNNTHVFCYGYNNRNAIFAYSFFALPFFFHLPNRYFTRQYCFVERIKTPNHISEVCLTKSISRVNNYVKMSENQESTVNDYFVNMLELGSEATNPDLVYLSIPNLPSTYVFNLNTNFLG